MRGEINLIWYIVPNFLYFLLMPPLSLHLKSYPPTRPRTLQKVCVVVGGVGGGWVCKPMLVLS